MSARTRGDRSSLARLVAAVFEKQLLILKRYWINTATMLVTTYVFFAMIFFGGQAAAGPAIEDSLDGIVVGFFLFTASVAAYFGTAQDLQREAQWGTLEQLFMSPHGIGRVMGVKSVWNVLLSVAIAAVMLALMVLTTDRAMTVDGPTVAVITVLTILPVLGIGFAFAGLSLLYKRIESVQQLMQFVLIGLIVAPAAGVPAYFDAAPLVLGSGMLARSMTDGVTLLEFDPLAFGVLVATGVGYLAAGYAVFCGCVQRARRLGVMGHY